MHKYSSNYFQIIFQGTKKGCLKRQPRYTQYEKKRLKKPLLNHVKVTFFGGNYVTKCVVSRLVFDSTESAKFSEGRPFVPSPTNVGDFTNVGALYLGAK